MLREIDFLLVKKFANELSRIGGDPSVGSVATSPVVLRWMCDSPRTGCAWRTTPYEQAIIEWSWHVISIVACCHSAKLCAHAARDRNKMVLWPGCAGRAEFSLHTKNVRSVRFVVKRRGCCCNLSGGVKKKENALTERARWKWALRHASTLSLHAEIAISARDSSFCAKSVRYNIFTNGAP